jgi:hypothetical protein
VTEGNGAPHDHVSTRSLAELAKAGYMLIRDPTMLVDFEVHHVSDVSGYFRDMVIGPAGEAPESVFVETLVSTANGVGLLIGTRTGSRYVGGNGTEPVVITEGRRNVFPGVAQPNPSFTYESARTFEAIIAIDSPDVRAIGFRRSLTIKKVIAYVSRLASDVARVPVLSAQWPAQVPSNASTRPDVPGREEGPPPRSSSLALRFSLALGESSAERRLQLGRHLIDYAKEHGFGLWLEDSRIGYRTGSWFHVCSVDPGLAAENDAAEPDDSQVSMCLPVTFVGPARVGSTSALMRYLESLPFVGVVGCSNTTLDDLAFIHLQLSLRGLTPRRLVEANKQLAGDDLLAGHPVEVLRTVFTRLGFEREVLAGRSDRRELPGRAFDYKTLAHSLFPCLPVSARRRMAIWFSWQVRNNDRGLQDVIGGLYRAFEDLGVLDARDDRWMSREESPNIEYLICRRFDFSILKGRGKISIPKDVVEKAFENERLEQPASRFCARLEAKWKAEVERADGFVELTVAWRERWLGHRMVGPL